MKPAPPPEIQAELLDRLSRLAPDHRWNWEKAQRVGTCTGLAPEALVQLLRDRQKETDGDGFLSPVRTGESRHQAGPIELGDALLKAPDQQHLPMSPKVFHHRSPYYRVDCMST
jgi:hypothetical protein